MHLSYALKSLIYVKHLIYVFNLGTKLCISVMHLSYAFKLGI